MLVSLCIAATLLAGSAAAATAPEGAIVGPAVIEALQTRDAVDVDVALRSTPSLTKRPFDLDALRAEVAELQNRVLAMVPPEEFQLRRRLGGVPAFTGSLTRPGLNRLRANPEVLRIDLPASGAAHLGHSVPLIGASAAHAAGLTGDGIVVAVLDTGLDTDHADLADDLIGEECFNGCPNGTDRQSGPGAAEDGHGHGTNVSGIITSRGTVSDVGVAPDAEIIAYKVLADDGTFSSLVDDVIAALDHIILNHPEVDVVNMSLGTFALFPGECDGGPAFNVIAATALDTLRANGVISLVSSGNEASGTQMTSPACLSGSEAVGATYDRDIGPFTFLGVCTDSETAIDQVACFSNSNAFTDLMAPGCAILSTGLFGSTSGFCGTSQAAPHAAGCAALHLQADPDLSPSQLDALLETSNIVVVDETNGLSFPRIDCSLGLAVGGTVRLSDAARSLTEEPPQTSGSLLRPVMMLGGAAIVALSFVSAGVAFSIRRRNRGTEKAPR